jgi:nitroreductase
MTFAPEGNGITAVDAILGRRSVRAFLPDPVDPAVVRRILEIASRSPTGSNIQPWRVFVAGGATRDKLCALVHSAFETGEPKPREDYVYYPEEMFEPALGMRRKQGKAMFTHLGIPREDKVGMQKQGGRNYLLFDAPIGLFFSIDRRHGESAWIDIGAFLQSVMVAARAFGLDTCPQQAFSKYHGLIRQVLPIPDGDVMVCGMAMGRADPAALINSYVADREPVESFATFCWE